MLGVYTVSTYFCYTKAILVRRKLRNNSWTTIAFVLHTGVLNNWGKMKIVKSIRHLKQSNKRWHVLNDTFILQVDWPFLFDFGYCKQAEACSNQNRQAEAWNSFLSGAVEALTITSDQIAFLNNRMAKSRDPQSFWVHWTVRSEKRLRTILLTKYFPANSKCFKHIFKSY